MGNHAPGCSGPYGPLASSGTKSMGLARGLIGPYDAGTWRQSKSGAVLPGLCPEVERLGAPCAEAILDRGSTPWGCSPLEGWVASNWAVFWSSTWAVFCMRGWSLWDRPPPAAAAADLRIFAL